MVEHDLAKVGVAGSSPVSRSIVKIRDSIYAISYFYSSPILDSKVRGLRCRDKPLIEKVIDKMYLFFQ